MAGIFMDQSRPTLLAVSAAIEADASLTSARRGAIRSAINTLCRIMGMPPAMVPADLNFIRRKLQGISPAAVGVKEKRFSTVKSQVAVRPAPSWPRGQGDLSDADGGRVGGVVAAAAGQVCADRPSRGSSGTARRDA